MNLREWSPCRHLWIGKCGTSRRSSWRIELHPQIFEAAMQKARDGRLGGIELGGDIGESPALKMMQLDRTALAFGESGQRFGHPQELFLANRTLARRRLIDREPLFQTRGRLVQCLLE